MHLQSLELFGFKSFADKTLFNFHEGVTAIVGPNGCGKSNLLDAIRWVLGEQSAKSLRGGEMADVIFDGTDNRKPLSFAEVSLTFTDCASELNVDWHDVRVTRRVYRDGNSEYLLNKTPCRLRDIQNLFADTGVGRTAYSMMEQGKIDMILSSRPEDRRAIFEEAAGITKYKTQKREALRKLEATEANLLRIGDVIKEVKRQIGSLQRQAGKARRYQALHADLRVLETHYSKKQLTALEADFAHCRGDIEKIATSEQTTRSKIDRGETELAEERRALDKSDIEVADIRAEAQRLQSEIAAHRSRIEFNRQRRDELSDLIERARGDIATAESKRKQHAAQIRESDALIEKTQRFLQSKQDELANVTELLDKLRAKREARQVDRETARASLSKYEARIDKLEDELAGITARRELTAEQIRQISPDIKEATKAREKVAAEIATARNAAETEQKKLEQLLAHSQAAKNKLGQAALFVPKLGASAHESVRKSLPKGALAWAIDKIVAPRAVEPVIRQLLSGVLIFAKLDQALACKKDEPTLAMATLDGEFVSVEGIVFGGSSTVKSDSLLERKMRVAGLEKEEAESANQREIFIQKRDQAKANVEIASRQLDEARAEYQSMHLSQSTSANKISLLQAEEKEAERKIDSLQSEKETLEQQIQVAGERVAELESELDGARAELAEQEAAQSAAETDEKGARTEEEKTLEALNDLRLAIATARQRHESLEAQRQPMAARETELVDLIAARRADITSYESKLAAQAQESRDAEVAIEEQTALAADAEAAANKTWSQRSRSEE